ncbi:hypothetical protein, partial [Neoroseomonas soli]|nr:hypothetical protein [Neoroseomonas soli]
MRRPAAALLAMMALGAPALGQEVPRVPMRVGSHADHGRLVFDWASRVPYTVEQEGERVVLRFAEPARIDLDAARRPPRNVLGVAEDDGAVVIRAAPGARLRHFRLGNRVVVDLLDAARGEAAQQATEAPPARHAPRNRPAAPDAAPAPPPPAPAA